MTGARYLAVAGLALAAVALTACGTGTLTGNPGPGHRASKTVAVAPSFPAPVTRTVTRVAPRPAPTPPPTRLSAASRNLLYVATMRPKFPGVSRHTLIRLGHGICYALDKGASVTRLEMMALRSGATVYQSGYMLGAAIPAYCPSYKYLIGG